jgi:hypothetical protein
MMTDTNVSSRESAEEALRLRDWTACLRYWADLNSAQEAAPAAAWLKTVEAVAEDEAHLGDIQAQAALGAIGTLRYVPGDAEALRALHKGVRWYVAAARQEPGAVMLDQAVYWYGFVKAGGLRDVEIETFFGEPETRERYRTLRGRDIPE